MKRVATIILNRNLPKPADKLYEHLVKYDNELTDVYILEAGSDANLLSKYCTWHATEDKINKIGLRYSRGMNYGLLKLYNSNKWNDYDAFFLITNDTELMETSTVEPLLKILDSHPRLGILSPCSKLWGEKHLLSNQSTKYFWYIHNNAYFLRRSFLDDILNPQSPTYMDFVFDGNNFRGYLLESELIAKAYANNWAAAITAEVFAEENESYLINKSALIKTESYDENIRLYLEEGKHWLRKKYGFNSRWSMNEYVKTFYDKFFEFNPVYKEFKL